MLSRMTTAVILLIVSVCLLDPALASNKRVALVIGNATYKHTSALANPLSDAEDVSQALKRLGFAVIDGRDLDKAGMDRVVRQFARDLNGADVGFFYYAGHGLQVDGQNFLVPIDSKMEDATGLEFETLRLETVHKAMERSTRTNLIFLDACRDNPLARNLARSLGTRSAAIGRGLAVVESGEGTLISFSTQPGNVALDGQGRNSPYATALVKQLKTSRDDVSSILISVRNDVMRETNRRQVPWEHSALTAKFYFQQPPADQPAASAAAAAAAAAGGGLNQQAELAFWNSIKDSSDPRSFESYLVSFPNGTFAPLARVRVEQLHTQRTLDRAEQDRQDAERRRQADETRRTQDEVRQLRETLAILERDRQAAASRAEAEQAARARQAAAIPQAPIPPPVVIPANSIVTPLTGEALARAVQGELKRLNCDPGAIDGKWSAKSRAALAEFARKSNVIIGAEVPTIIALDALRSKQGRVCTLVCDDDEEEKNGVCVAKPKRSHTAKTPECDDDEVLKNGRCVPVPKKSASSSRSDSSSSRQTTQRSAPSAKSSSDMCWDAQGRLVRCRDLGGSGYNGNQR